MRRDAGVVLINALVIVLAISVVAAALLTRSEAARIRAIHAQGAHQLELYLDAGEGLVPGVLKQVVDEVIVHDAQVWASDALRFPIDRGSVAVRLVDLQGRLNVNWLRRDDPYAQEVFAQVFSELRVPLSLLAEITDFVSPGGPRGAADYMARTPSVLPRGWSMRQIDDLREVRGMTPEHFATLSQVLSALPSSSRINLNTAPRVVLKAVVAPLPEELKTEILNRDTPIRAMVEIRDRAMELLQTEDIEELKFEWMTIASNWFRADLVATLDGIRQRRQAVFRVDQADKTPVSLLFRWAVYD